MADKAKDPLEKKRYMEMYKLGQKHEFWDTQPTQKFLDRVEKTGPITDLSKEKVSDKQIELPAGFEWSVIDLNDEA